jgi:aspartate/methionine/tyrosine aminotransferase
MKISQQIKSFHKLLTSCVPTVFQVGLDHFVTYDAQTIRGDIFVKTNASVLTKRCHAILSMENVFVNQVSPESMSNELLFNET